MTKPDAFLQYLGDDSDDVRIRVPKKKVVEFIGYIEVDVPMAHVKKFILNYLRWESINNLKSMDFAELELHFTDGFPPENSPIWNDFDGVTVRSGANDEPSYPHRETNLDNRGPVSGQQLVVSAETPPRPNEAPATPPPSSGRPTGHDYSLYNEGQNP